ncbi:MAG: tetratricopeptide repeat protein [Bryobacteraceae bacterium]
MKTKPSPRHKSAVVSSVPKAAAPGGAWRPWLGFAIALVVVFLVYEPALNGPFVFDDQYLPVNMGVAGRPLTQWLIGVRPALMFTLWLNYRISGFDTFSYHAFNVFFHTINAFLLFWAVRRILGFASVGAKDLFALFAGALFLLHPVQTESVAYVSSRSENLSLLFFLAAFVLFLYRPGLTDEEQPPVSWPAAAGILALFGAAVATKEHTITLPALLLLTDLFWNRRGGILAGVRRNWRLYIPIAVGAAGGLAFVLRILSRADSAGFALKTVKWYEYFFTQWRAVFLYLRLYVLPVDLSLEYDFPLSRTPLDHGAAFGLAALLAMSAAALYYRKRFPVAAYGWFAFLLLLAPTSSIVPISDPVAERRLYLPIIGLLLISIEFLRRLNAGRAAMGLGLSGVLLAAGAGTYSRNFVWADRTALWEDTVAKTPTKARAQFQLGFAYFEAGRCQDAVRHFEIAAGLQPPDARLLVDWALAYDCLDQPDLALAKLNEAAKLERAVWVYANLGMIHAKQNQRDEAFAALKTAVEIDPNFDMTYVYLGHLHFMANDFRQAAAEYRRAVSLNPDNRMALDSLAKAEQNLKGH